MSIDGEVDLSRINIEAVGVGGPRGQQGVQGPQGETGPAGPANTLTIGTVQEGETAAATITGDSPSQVLNLVLPKGEKGDTGEKGEMGAQGAKGDKGDKGEAGEKGDKGDRGPAGTTNYTDMTNKPSINNVTLEGDKTSEDLGLQPAGDYATRSDIPTELSDLTNDSGFITKSVSDLTNYYDKGTVDSKVSEKADRTDIPTKTSQIVNDSGFITKSVDDLANYYDKDETAELLYSKADKNEIPTKVSDLDNDSGYITRTANNLTNYYKKSETYSKDETSELLESKADKTNVPTKTSQLTNDSGFITNIVDDLVNYYTKSNTYTKTEVNALIGQIEGSHFEVVEELPAQGDSNVIYLVPRDPGEEGNIYNEYIWINNDYEMIGSTDMDLAGYVKNTDYASSGAGGVIKVGTYGANVGAMVSNLGQLYCNSISYATYSQQGDNYFVGKGTLENVITGKGLVSDTDYATSVKGGVVKTGSQLGILINANGNPYIDYAVNADISSKTSYRKPIVPATLDYAVKVGVTTNTNALTDTEKDNACKWLGATTQADTDTLSKTGLLPIKTTWTNTYIDSYGTETASDVNLSTGKIAAAKVIINCPSGYQYVKRYFNSSDAITRKDTTWQSSDVVASLGTDAYLRISFKKSNGSTMTLSDAVPLYEPTLMTEHTEEIETLQEDLQDTNDNIAEFVDLKPIAEYSVNLYNPDDPTAYKGGWERGGVYSPASTYNQTGLIEVEVGEKYTASYRSAFVSWYKADKTFLSETDSSVFARDGYVTAPANAKYVRFVYLKSGESTFEAVKGQTMPTNYEPYYCAFDKKKFLNTSGVNFVSYGDSIVERNKWQPFLVDNFGFTHTNLGIGSTTVAYIASREADYPCMVNADRIQEIKDADPNLIVIMGGTNDAHLSVSLGSTDQLSTALESKDKTTFYGAYSFLIETLLTWKPKLTIILMNPMTSSWSVPSYDPYAEAVEVIAKYYAIPLANTHDEARISKFDPSTFTEDGLHPNEAGGRVIANLVAMKIMSTMLLGRP